jgi:hypothetical protein
MLSLKLTIGASIDLLHSKISKTEEVSSKEEAPLTRLTHNLTTLLISQPWAKRDQIWNKIDSRPQLSKIWLTKFQWKSSINMIKIGVATWTRKRHWRCLTISWWIKEGLRLPFHSLIDSLPITITMAMAWSQETKLPNLLENSLVSLTRLSMTQSSNWFSKSLQSTIKTKTGI